ncbi:MAG TPA: hypothetical protein VM122_14480 [Usitatibacter sp.]|nr:hypothetical protein [Usitatibacter sp.]
MAILPWKSALRSAAMVALLGLAAGEALARPAPPPGIRSDLNREMAVQDTARDLIAGTITEVSSPGLDGRRSMVVDVSQVFQGTLWRGQHTVQWIPASQTSPVPPTGTRVLAFVNRGKDGNVAVSANEIFADNPENRAAASVRYVRIGRSDYSLEVLLVASGIALGLAALFALRQRRRNNGLKARP